MDPTIILNASAEAPEHAPIIGATLATATGIAGLAWTLVVAPIDIARTVRERFVRRRREHEIIESVEEHPTRSRVVQAGRRHYRRIR